ncbi:hypothetical protein AVEN_221907-1, partial [Araneus ventricosus]
TLESMVPLGYSPVSPLDKDGPGSRTGSPTALLRALKAIAPISS